LGSLKSKSTPALQVGAPNNKGLPLPLRSSGGSCRSARNAFNRPTTLGKPTQIGKLVREDCRNSSNMCPLWRIWLNRFQLCRTNSKEGVSHGKSSVSFAHLGDHMCRCGDRRHAWRKCSEQIRRHVDCCVSDKIWAVSAGVPRRSTVVDGVMEVGGTMGSLIGRVSRNGSVRATGYMGANYGVASGRVSGNFGSGTWRAHTESGNCAGVWNAQRR
jgi:hypothetical protein